MLMFVVVFAGLALALKPILHLAEAELPGPLSDRQRLFIVAATLTVPAIVAVSLADEPAVAVAATLVFAICPAVAVIDLADYRIPDRFTYPTYLAVTVLIGAAWIRSAPDGLIGWPAGMLAGFGFLLVLHLLSPASMGFGDVKLMGLLGGPVGWAGIVLIPIALGIASFLGVVGQITTRRHADTDTRRHVPFAPYLAVSAYVVVVARNPLLDLLGAT